MPIEITSNRKTLNILDNYSQESFQVIVCIPNSKLRIAYQSEATEAIYENRGDAAKGAALLYDIRAKYFEGCIVEIQQGYFTINGEPVDTSFENKAVWFTLLKEFRSDIIDAIMTYLFGDTSRVVKEGNLNFLKK